VYIYEDELGMLVQNSAHLFASIGFGIFSGYIYRYIHMYTYREIV
jgi:hypothetical protein